ncbi:MAG: UxaA family hydrolase [Rhodospirillales bacterium]|jgi:altronate dehydratase large subunit|nr:UxaA family hydrolase [Rhodospirillales bacterium]
MSERSFQGYERPDGSIGVRNHLLILSITGLTGPTARRIGRSIPGARVFAMPFGSGIVGEDYDLHRRSLIGLGRNPNVGAVLLIGGHPPQVAEFAQTISETGKPVVALTLDECGHDALTLTDRGLRAAAGLARDLSRQRRRPAPLSALFVAGECGRSDPSSGLVSNPLVGGVVDAVVDSGGRAVIGETMEWFGTVHLLQARAADPSVAEAISEAVRRREDAAIAAGIDLLGDNPGPTNIEAGLSTLEEKALGAIAKGGSRPIQGVIGMAEAPPGPGLWFMDAPAYAPESMTGMVAAGAQLVLFTTGAGNSFVNSIAPTIKISANPDSVDRLNSQIDFEATQVFEGRRNLADAVPDLLDLAMEVASGTMTFGEILDEGEEVVSRMGPAL